MKYQRIVEVEAIKYDGDFIYNNGKPYVPEWIFEALRDGTLKFVDDGKLMLHSKFEVIVGDYLVKEKRGIFLWEEDKFKEVYKPCE